MVATLHEIGVLLVCPKTHFQGRVRIELIFVLLLKYFVMVLAAIGHYTILLIKNIVSVCACGLHIAIH